MLNPWAKNSASPACRFGRDRLGVEAALGGVRHQDHDQVGLGAGGGRIDDPQALGLGLRAALRALGEADADVDAGVAQAQRVRVALAAVAQHGDLPALDDRQIGVVVVEQLSSHGGTPWFGLVLPARECALGRSGGILSRARRRAAGDGS